MRCPKCNTSNKDDAKFCRKCGKTLKLEKPKAMVPKKADKPLVEELVIKCGEDMKDSIFPQLFSELNSVIAQISEEASRVLEAFNTTNQLNSKLVSENEGYRKTIEVQKMQLIELKKGRIICPLCGREYDEKITFCSDCGTKIEYDEDAEDDM